MFPIYTQYIFIHSSHKTGIQFKSLSHFSSESLYEEQPLQLESLQNMNYLLLQRPIILHPLLSNMETNKQNSQYPEIQQNPREQPDLAVLLDENYDVWNNIHT